MARPVLGPGPPKWRTWERGATRPYPSPPPPPSPADSAPLLWVSVQLALGAERFPSPPLFCFALALFTALPVSFTLKSQPQRSRVGIYRNLERLTEPVAPRAPRRSRNRARFCVTSARRVIYLPRASVNMTNFHWGQKAFLRQSILERSLTRQTGLVVLFPALEINTLGGVPAWGVRE